MAAKRGLLAQDMHLLAPVCVYLAIKVEEFRDGGPSARYVALAMQRLHRWWPYNEQAILDAEFFVLEQLEFHLVVHHPLRVLPALLADAQVGTQLCTLETVCGLVNDSFRTDLALFVPPHVVALACIFVASFVLPGWPPGLTSWLGEQLSVDVGDVGTAVGVLLELCVRVWTPHCPPYCCGLCAHPLRRRQLPGVAWRTRARRGACRC